MTIHTLSDVRKAGMHGKDRGECRKCFLLDFLIENS